MNSFFFFSVVVLKFSMYKFFYCGLFGVRGMFKDFGKSVSFISIKFIGVVENRYEGVMNNNSVGEFMILKCFKISCVI